ncbi:hypothetical protein SK128_006001 [Halocaridina rubra]|uniref:Uncharacterized protein n=1 Tax=Halocaridina rubra TaxID=373956 RepID=A0AAN8ZUA1_HALRR
MCSTLENHTFVVPHKNDEYLLQESSEHIHDKLKVLESIKSKMIDHGCQTDEEYEASTYRRGYSGTECDNNILEKENIVYKSRSKDSSPSCDQEIQVSIYDIINPLKRCANHKSRHYDLTDMPKLKRRIYMQRKRSSATLTRSRSLPSCDISQIASDSQLSLESYSNFSKNHETVKTSLVNRFKYREFGITNTSSLVASLMDLARDLPSAYPEGQLEPQGIDDFEDIDHEVFQHFSEGEVIKTLSGCYRGEFPHIPVSGHMGSASVHRTGHRGDLISLRDLRCASLPGFLECLPVSDNNEEVFQESPLLVVQNSFQPMDPLTAHMMDSGVSLEENIYSHFSSSESVSISANSDEQKVHIGSDEDTEVSTSSVLTPSFTTGNSSEDSSCAQDKKIQDAWASIQDVHPVKEVAEKLSNTDTVDEKETTNLTMDHEADKQDEVCMCKAYGTGLHRGKVGRINTFILDTGGAEHGEVTVKVEGPSKGSVLGTEVYPFEDLAGAYEVQFRVSLPGYYTVVIMWSGQHLLGSPFTCYVNP